MRRFLAVVVVSSLASSLAACTACDPCSPFDPCGSRRLPPPARPMPAPVVRRAPVPMPVPPPPSAPAPTPVPAAKPVPDAPPPADALPASPPATPAVPAPGPVGCDDAAWPDVPSAAEPLAKQSLEMVISNATKWLASDACDPACKLGWAQVLVAANACRDNGAGHSSAVSTSPHAHWSCELLVASVQRAGELSADAAKGAECLSALRHENIAKPVETPIVAPK